MNTVLGQRYTANDLRKYINKTIMFEADVTKSGLNEGHQFPLLMVSDVRDCKNGNVVIVGINLMRLKEEKYNMAEDKAKPYRSFNIDNIKYGSIKLVID